MLPPTTTIRAALDASGYVHVRERLDRGEFEALAATLGDVLREEDIALYRSTRGAHQPRTLGFHTDPAQVATIAWWCVTPATEGGATLLFDLAGLIESLPDDEFGRLAAVQMRCPCPDGGAARVVPFVERDPDGRVQLFYADWQVLPIRDPDVNAAWKRLRVRIEDAIARDAFGVRLEQGEMLFLDNRRMVHGRGELPKDSPRHLLRLWLARR